MACMLALTLLTALFAPSLAAAKYRTLEFGSRGTEVLKLQKGLLQLGFDPNGTDGKFGRGTERAVKAYQSARGLTADGKAGNLTLTKLYAELDGKQDDAGSGSSTPPATSPSTLKYGDSGPRVTELQNNLKKLGYYTGTADGRFGAGTQRAVIAFQRANGLTADGLAGSKTLSLLQRLASAAGNNNNNNNNNGTNADGYPSHLTRTLRRGYTGEDVKTVQTRLKELKYFTASVDSVYGAGSIAAVKAFQQKNGLSADGLAGKNTFKKLFAANAVPATSSSGSSGNSSSGGDTYVKLQSGDTGEAVRKLQKALRDLKYPISVDGTYGAETVSAVIEFQRLNGLTPDGVAGVKTQQKLYSGSAVPYTASGSGSGSSDAGASSLGSFTAANGAKVRILHWFNEIKPSLKNGQYLEAYDPATGISWTLRVMSRGNHADVEPLTAQDTAQMNEAFGGKESWGPKVVYVKLPDGRWSIAATHNVAHGGQTISGNNFDGQNCVHFLRDMAECEKNDPHYGVQNQNAIRKAWKSLTGIVVD